MWQDLDEFSRDRESVIPTAVLANAVLPLWASYPEIKDGEATSWQQTAVPLIRNGDGKQTGLLSWEAGVR